MKKSYFFPFFFLSVLIQGTGCVCMTHKEFCARNEEIKTLRLDLQFKEKTISELLDRLSQKDQEIGKLTDELRSAEKTIQDIKGDIEKLREVDMQVEEKKKEVDTGREEKIPESLQGIAGGTGSVTTTDGLTDPL